MHSVARCFSAWALLVHLFAASITIAQSPVVETPGKARHEILTTAAWEALEKKDYPTAIAQADKCLDDFAPTALRMQRELADGKIILPEGKVTEADKTRIFANGVLNDVAACLYIKGFSAERLQRIDEAEKAYRQAVRYKHARVWDAKKEMFWAVAELCEIRARALRLPPAERDALLADLLKPVHERETGKAWDAFNNGDYRAAIAHADVCIQAFDQDAQSLQQKLAKDGAVVPVGAVDEAEKQKIFSNGVLNDVATCLFIKGRSAERLRDVPQAKAAYSASAKLTYARSWDPQGWFWSVADGASDRLELLP